MIAGSRLAASRRVSATAGIIATGFASALAAGLLIALLGYVVVQGWSAINPSFMLQ